ncbi:MAG: ABC transporter permease [Bifidobacteriaceae bacterium]|jgi:ABC-type transport system involved in multi-copper enzyme maturation permease subunit|nr:ABC transporter permease [Bifidobacteriaceae bacterium]
MRAAIKSEFRKLFSTRMWWILMLCAAAYLMFMSLMMAFSLEFSIQQVSPEDLATAPSMIQGDRLALLVYSMAGSMAYVFPLLIGALSVTQEYRHKTITPTFLAEPRRVVVLGAKLISSLPMGLVYGLVCLAATVLPAAIVFTVMGGSNALDKADTWEFFARALLDFSLWAPVGVGVGALLRSQVAAIVVVLAETQFAEPILRMVPSLTNWDWKWIEFLPGSAGDAIQGVSFYSLMGLGDSSAASTLPWGWSALVLGGWAVLFCALAYPLSWKRDIS